MRIGKGRPCQASVSFSFGAWRAARDQGYIMGNIAAAEPSSPGCLGPPHAAHLPNWSWPAPPPPPNPEMAAFRSPHSLLRRVEGRQAGSQWHCWTPGVGHEGSRHFPWLLQREASPWGGGWVSQKAAAPLPPPHCILVVRGGGAEGFSWHWRRAACVCPEQGR